MIWVYAICERPEIPAPRRRGLAQAPLEGVRAGDLLAVITRHSHTPAEPAPDALWAHERVVERLMADRAVLPMRFGTTMPDTEALTAAIVRRHAELLQRLAAVRGRVELGVRAIVTDNGDPAAGMPPAAPADARRPNGREYLMGKLEEERRIDHAAAALHEPLARLAVDSRRQPGAPGEVLRAAYLVERADVGRFLSRVESLQRAQSVTSVLCTGPWPPYSFVALVGPATREEAMVR
ncbi:MAG TPA: GvpL/GvpF family gas vesicle protein [Baekduia sp.]|nr:GvpL/GvpF family gas vesicle protein [Baekduia sp.]